MKQEYKGGRTSGATGAHTRERESSDVVSAAVILTILILGLVGLYLSVTHVMTESHAANTLLEHFSSACIVASLLGLTYERLAHKKRQEAVDRVLEENRETTMEAFNVFIKLTPERVFQLIKDIAEKGDKVPTLYRPARQEDKEYTFADSVDYFDSLLRIGREEVVEELESWVSDENGNVKFLGSDFIGMYQLEELKERLDERVDGRFKDWARKKHPLPDAYGFDHRKWDEFWGEVSQEECGWMLNYIWASSRCESPMYKTLEKLLLATRNAKVQEWILFVPQQMPHDVRFLEIIQNYLASRSRSQIPACQLKLIVKAVGKMKVGYASWSKVFVEYAELFNTKDLKKEIEEVWQAHGKNPKKLIGAIESRGAASVT